MNLCNSRGVHPADISDRLQRRMVHRTKDKLEGYGRITQKRTNIKVGHYFWNFTVAKPVDIELTYRYQLKDMFMIFLTIPHNQVSVEWFGHRALSK